MKTLRTSKKAKAAAFVLCVLCLTLALGCQGPLTWLNTMGAGDGYDCYKDSVEDLLLENYVQPAAVTLQSISEAEGADPDAMTREMLREVQSWMDRDKNLFYTVRGSDGRVLAASKELGDYRARHTEAVTLPEVVRVDETYDTQRERDAAVEKLEQDYDEVSLTGDTGGESGPFVLKANLYDYDDFGNQTLLDTYEATFYQEDALRNTLAQLQDQYPLVDYDITSQSEDGGYPLQAVCINWNRGETLTVSGFIRAEMASEGQTWQQLSQAAALYNARTAYQVLIPAGVAVGLLCLVFLLWATGHEREREGIALSGFDYKGPVDLLLPAGLIAVLIWLAAGLDPSGWKLIPDLFPILPYGLLCLALAFGLYVLLSVVRRVKAKEPQKGTLFFAKAGKVCGRGLKKAGGRLEKLADRLPLFWLAAAVFLAFAFLEGLSIVAVADGIWGGVFLWFLFKALELAGVIWLALAFRRLQAGGKELAAGNLDYQVDLASLKGPFRTHGENLNSIRAAIQSAVEDQMKSERMKTELITNVSHDIKTPLTSIVSYVDLLKKQPMPTDEAREYLEVLDRQSARLKKLTEDLVEASKASTGNLPVDLERTDVNVLLSQGVGEYQERLSGKDLKLVLTPAQGNPCILADGRLLWRVFDNLLSNIEKYAQPGTRVYLSSASDGDRVTILFRNISASPLNISADELMERFVRGDEARTTEGSGLGLAIARDLTGLQGGTFDLSIDGDLFKVRLAFPRVK